MRRPTHCCFENSHLEFVWEFDIRISNFIFLQLGFINFDARGFIDRVSGQRIQISPDESIRIFPQVFGPATSGFVSLAKRNTCDLRHGSLIKDCPCFYLRLRGFHPYPVFILDPKPLRRLRIDLHPCFPSLKHIGSDAGLKPGLVGIAAACQRHCSKYVEMKWILFFISSLLRFLPMGEERNIFRIIGQGWMSLLQSLRIELEFFCGGSKNPIPFLKVIDGVPPSPFLLKLFPKLLKGSVGRRCQPPLSSRRVHACSN